MKILVTGCLGFIASHFAARCIGDGHSVVGVARNTDQKNLARLSGSPAEWTSLPLDPTIAKRFRLVYQDLNDTNFCELLEDIDIVVNFAAKTFVDYSVRDAKPFFESNVLGTHNLLEAVRKYPRIKQFVQISTDEVYGPLPDNAEEMVHCANGWREDAPLNPTNPYSASKAASDMLCIGYAHTYKIPLLLTRTENNYGYFQHPQKVIPNWVKKSLNNEKLPIYGDGRHKRMWLRVEDHVSAILFLIEKEARGIYHIAGGQEMENIDLAKILLRTLQKPADMIEFIDDSTIRPNHDRRYGLDTSKIRALGWKPAWDMEAGIADAVNWYARNRWWIS